MDFDMDWAEEELIRAAAAFFSDREARQQERDSDGVDLAGFRELGALGWLEIGNTRFLELALIFEEMGKAAWQSPALVSGYVVPSLLSIAGHDSDEVRSSLQAASTIATVEAGIGSMRRKVPEVVLSGGVGNYALTGVTGRIPWLPLADQVVLEARAPGAPSPILVLVPTASGSPISSQTRRTISGIPAGRLHFDETEVSDQSMLWRLSEAPQREAFQQVLLRTSVLQAADIVGMASAAFDAALAYSRQRHAFGRAISGFQVIQHKLADMVALRDQARFLTLEAAGAIDEGWVEHPSIPSAKPVAVNAAKFIVKEAHQIFGGAGFIKENPLYRHYVGVRDAETMLVHVDDLLEMVVDMSISAIMAPP